MLSIIIITKNEEKYLPKLLESIKKQSLENYEIIVSDAGSKDKTREIARRYNAKVVKGGFPGKGRNNGAKASKGDWLLFLDADVILPQKNFLKKALEEVNGGNYDIASSKVLPLGKNLIDLLLYQITNIYIVLAKKIKPVGPGAFILVKKEFFNLVGGFRDDINMGEDHNFIEKVIKNRGSFVILKNPIYVSERRLKKEGRISIILRYIIHTTYRLLTGKEMNGKKGFMEYKLEGYKS